MRKKIPEENKKKINSTVLSPEITSMIDKIAEKEGSSKSYFIRKCIMEKLQRLGLLSIQSVTESVQSEV